MESIEQIKSNKYLIKITIPFFIEMLFGILVGSIDQFMIRSQSENAYAAIGISNQIVTLLLFTFNVIAVASTILISQYRGAKQNEKIEQIYSLSFVITSYSIHYTKLYESTNRI